MLKKKHFEEIISSVSGTDLKVGQAFITFQTQADARVVHKKFGKQLTYQLWHLAIKTFCGCCFEKHIEMKLKSRHINAQPADEPSDIF